jgi:hypothetical protein
VKTLFKLLIAVLLLTGTMVSDGGSCIPWTPQSCVPNVQVRGSGGPEYILAAPRANPSRVWSQLADGGQCIPWTPTSCVPSVVTVVKS